MTVVDSNSEHSLGDAQRILAFGHGGYLGQKTRETARTGKIFDASVAWAGRGRKAIGYRVPGPASWNGAAVADATGVIVMNAEGLDDAKRYAAVDAFVRNGGGLIIASLGWGWTQLHPGKDLLTQHAGNRFLRRAGIVRADGYLERTSPGTRPHEERCRGRNGAPGPCPAWRRRSCDLGRRGLPGWRSHALTAQYRNGERNVLLPD